MAAGGASRLYSAPMRAPLALLLLALCAPRSRPSGRSPARGRHRVLRRLALPVLRPSRRSRPAARRVRRRRRVLGRAELRPRHLHAAGHQRPRGGACRAGCWWGSTTARTPRTRSASGRTSTSPTARATCTGATATDVHGPSGTYAVHHRGAVNAAAAAVLGLRERARPEPGRRGRLQRRRLRLDPLDRALMAHYSGASVVHLSDSGGGGRAARLLPIPLANWDPPRPGPTSSRRWPSIAWTPSG